MSVWDRAGTAYTSGAPIGASVDVGQHTQDATQAKVAGRAFGAAASTSGYTLGYGQAVQPPQSPAGQSNYGNAGGQKEVLPASKYLTSSGVPLVAGASSWILDMLHRPVEASGNLYQSYLRSIPRIAEPLSKGDLSGAASAWWHSANGGGIASILLDPKARADWEDAVGARASVGQTAERLLSGAKDGFALLDDPTRRQEKDDYYSSGKMRMTVGVADAAFSIFADPLVFAGKAVSVARASRGLLTAQDITRASDRALDFKSLTGKQMQTRDVIDSIAESADEIIQKPGGLAALSTSAMFKQSSDAGNIPYLLKRVSELPEMAGNPILRKETYRTVIQAGIGDIKSLDAIGQRSALLKVEIDNMSSVLNGKVAANRLAETSDDGMESLFASLNAEPKWMAEVKAQQKIFQDEFEAIARVQRTGWAAGERVPGQVTNRGELARLPQGEGGLVGDVLKGRLRAGSYARQDMAHIVKTVQSGRFTSPVHMITGQHVPSVLRLSDDSAPGVFDEVLSRGRQAGMNPEQLLTLRDKFRGAVSNDPQITRTLRGQAVREFESAFDQHLATKYGVSLEQVKPWMTRLRALRQGELDTIRSHIYKAQPGEVPVVRTADDAFAFGEDTAAEMRKGLDGKILLGTQQQDMVSVLDAKKIDAFVSRYQRDGFAGFVTKGVEGTWNVAEHSISAANHLWKFAALFRLGYPARVQVDTQARAIATLGVARWFANSAEGASNTLYNNMTRVDASVAQQFTRRFAANQQIASANWELKGLSSEELLNPSAKVSGLQGQIHAAKQVLAEPMPAPSGKMQRIRGTDMAKMLGKPQRITKSGEIKGKFDPLAAYPSANEFHRAIAKFDASQNTVGMLTDGEGDIMRKVRETGAWDVIPGSREEWMGSYLRAVNRQVRNDKVGTMILGGQSDAEILNWVHNVPEGQGYWKGLGHEWDGAANGGDDAAVWLGQVREHVNTLLPDDQIRNLVIQRDVTSADVSAMWPLPSQRPGVPGEILAQRRSQNQLAQIYDTSSRGFFKLAADMPENMMGRHPMYRSAFDARASAIVRDTGIDKAELSMSSLNEVRRKADVLARRDIAKVMFDTSKQSNLGYHLRFMSPFYSAWGDMMSKWSHIIGNDFSAGVNITKVFRAPNAAGLIVDDQGRVVHEDGKVYDESGNVVDQVDPLVGGNLILPLPDSVKKWSGSGDVIIRKEAMNIIFQGSPWFLPGPGPLMSIPASEVMLNVFPETGPGFADTAIGQWFNGGMGLPKGNTTFERAANSLEPSWMKKAWDATAGFSKVDNTTVRTAYAQEYQSIVAEIQQGVRGEMTPDEIDTMATQHSRNQMILRFAGAEAIVSTNPRGRFQFYVDKWRSYRTQYGLKAYDQFVQDYPEYQDLAMSMSVNKTGIAANEGAYRSSLPYRQAIDRNPDYGWFFAGEQNLLGQFSDGVYEKQTTMGDRTPMTAQARIDGNSITSGWASYTKTNMKLREALAERGLKTFDAKGAHDLKGIRDEFILGLEKANPTWAKEFNSRESGDTAAKFLSYATEQVKLYPALEKRGDIQALASYLSVRQQLMQVLSDRHIGSLKTAGGDATRGAEDLKMVWDEFTAGLVEKDIGFEQMWDRALDGDRLSTETW